MRVTMRRIDIADDLPRRQLTVAWYRQAHSAMA